MLKFEKGRRNIGMTIDSTSRYADKKSMSFRSTALSRFGDFAAKGLEIANRETCSKLAVWMSSWPTWKICCENLSTGMDFCLALDPELYEWNSNLKSQASSLTYPFSLFTLVSLLSSLFSSSSRSYLSSLFCAVALQHSWGSPSASISKSVLGRA